MSFYLHHLHSMQQLSSTPLTEENFRVLGGFESLMAGWLSSFLLPHI
jgi:hypothetical protein